VAGNLIDSLRSFSHLLPAAIVEAGADHPAVRQLDIQDSMVAAQVIAVQKRAYRVEARIIGYDRIPALQETVESLRHSGETFYGLFSADRLIATVSIVLDGSILTICRLVVEPGLQRRGMASRLLTHLNYRYPDASIFRVATAARNNPALRFYTTRGFRETRRWKTADGLELVEFECCRSRGMRP
jgi:GNAT superfamily N-acetyltransferase